MQSKLRALLKSATSNCWTPLGLLALMCLWLAAVLMLTACTTQTQVPVVKQACPQLPALPSEFQKVNANALEQTAQNFKDFMSGN